MYKSSNAVILMLNSEKWVTAQGEILDPYEEMSKEHVSNCMSYLYRNRDKLLFHSPPEIIEQYKNPDEFFEKAVTRSIIWNTFLRVLKEPDKSNILQILDDDVRHEYFKEHL